MPTSKQLKDRSALIRAYAEEVPMMLSRSDNAGRAEQIRFLTKTVPAKYRTDVMVMALARGYISPGAIPPEKAREVAEKLLKKAPDRIRDDSAQIGTEVHEIMERLANGEIFDVNPEYDGYVTSWRNFMQDWRVQVIRTEFAVMSETHQYAGTGDLLFVSGNHPEMGIILGDYKSSASGIWPDIALQLAALKYADFILECHARPHDDEYEHKANDVEVVRGLLEDVDSYVGIQIRPEGYKVVPVNVTRRTFDVFRAAQIVAYWTTDMKDKALEKADFIPNETS